MGREVLLGGSFSGIVPVGLVLRKGMSVRDLQGEECRSYSDLAGVLSFEFFSDKPAPRPAPRPAARMSTMAKVNIQKISGLNPQTRRRAGGSLSELYGLFSSGSVVG